MAVDQYALTTLTKLKTTLGISTSTDDTLMEGCIDRASDIIEGWLDYKVLARDYSEWIDISRIEGPMFRLANQPVVSVRSVALGCRDAFTITASSSLLAATVAIDGSKVRVLTTDTSGTDTTTDIAFATYKSVSSVVAQLNGITGVSASTIQNGRSAQLHITPGSSFVDRSVVVGMAWDEGTRWKMDRTNGVVYLQCGPWWLGGSGKRQAQAALVEYNAGESAVPDDIEAACLSVASWLYNAGKRDPSLQSESLGDYSYTTKIVGDQTSFGKMLADTIGHRRRLR